MDKSDEYYQRMALTEQKKHNAKLLTTLNNIVAELRSIDDKLACMVPQPMSPDEIREILSTGLTDITP